MEQVRQEVRQQVCYDVLVQRMDQELLDELIGLIVETLCDKAQTIRIGSHDYPVALVQGVCGKLTAFASNTSAPACERAIPASATSSNTC